MEYQKHDWILSCHLNERDYEKKAVKEKRQNRRNAATLLSVEHIKPEPALGTWDVYQKIYGEK